MREKEQKNKFETNNDLIFKTVERITESLNRRFEKNAELYISNQDLYNIKESIANSDFKSIIILFENKKHSSEILTKVILQNAWLMRPLYHNHKKLDPLRPIFKRCQEGLFIQITQKVLSGEIDAPLHLRNMLELLFYERVPIEKCEEVLETGHNNLRVLAICFRRTIKNTSSSEQLYNEAKRHFKSYPNIQKQIQSIPISHLEQNQQEKLAQIIFDHDIIPIEKPHWFWRNTFSNLNRISFDKCQEYLKKTRLRRDPNLKKIVKIIAQIMNRNKQESDYFSQELTLLYQYKSNIRYSLILFGAKAIANRDIELAQKIIREFQKIEIPKIQVLENTVRDILAGKTSDVKIESVEDLVELIGVELTEGHRRFLIAIFKKTQDFETMFKELLSNHRHESFVQDFIAELLRHEPNPHFLHITLSYWTKEKDENFKEKLLEVIRERRHKTPIVRDFLFNNHYDLFQEIFGKTYR